MTGSRSNQSLNKLLRVYAYRKRIAEAKVEEQKSEVHKSRVELREREEKVAKLDAEIKENVDFLDAAGANVGAEVLHAANRHRYWTDYDKQKESYYVDLTQQELSDNIAELDRRRIALTKLEAKTSAIDTLVSKNHADLERKQELDLEDEFDALFASRRGAHV